MDNIKKKKKIDNMNHRNNHLKGTYHEDKKKVYAKDCYDEDDFIDEDEKKRFGNYKGN